MSSVAPYRMPGPDSVRAGAWRLIGIEEELPLADEMPGWDYATDLSLRRALTVDIPAVLEGTGLPADARLGVTVLWWPDTSKLRRASKPQEVDLEASGEVELRLEMTGSELGGRLTLETVLVLLNESRAPKPWIAHRHSSELWSDRFSVRLQGEGAMFPMAVVNLADHNHPPNAPWVFEPPELDAAAMGSMYLLINESNAAVTEAVQKAGDPEPVDAAILSTMYHDVGRTMVDIALSHDEVVSGLDFEDETFGNVLQGLLSSLFPDDDFAQLKKRRETDPARFAAELAARLRLMAAGAHRE